MTDSDREFIEYVLAEVRGLRQDIYRLYVQNAAAGSAKNGIKRQVAFRKFLRLKHKDHI